MADADFTIVLAERFCRDRDRIASACEALARRLSADALERVASGLPQAVVRWSGNGMRAEAIENVGEMLAYLEAR